MNASFRILTLLALSATSSAVAEDAYYAIPLGELNITEGELPQPDQIAAQQTFPRVRAPWFGQWNRPYATLQGAGEAYVGALSGTDDSVVPAQVPGWLTSQRLVLRAPQGKEIRGHLFLPQSTNAGMTVVAFAVTPDQARSDAKATFRRMKSEHYARLAEMGLPGGAWFRHQAEQARLKSTFAPAPFVAAPFPALRRRSPTDLAGTYSLFTGGRAVAENLQLDRVLPPARTGTDTVSVDSISGVAVREIDWQPLIAGLAPVTDPLAALIPADQYAVFFPDAGAAAKVTDILSEGGTIFLRLADPRVEDLRTIARYEQQLGMSIRDAAAVLKHLPVRSLAVTGSDLYFAQGTDIAVLLETAEPEQLAALVLAQMGLKSLGDTTAAWSQGKVGEVEFRGVQNVDRSRSSYVAALPGAVVVTNSLYQLGRLASVKSGESAALATLPEYTFFRHQYPKGDAAETAFGMLSDAAIRRLCGPRWRIGASRRTRDAAVLMQLQAAHFEELALRNVTPRELQDAARLSAAGSVKLSGSGVVASPAGSLAFMTPIGELPLDRVTYAEAQAYEQWRRGYESNWTWAFDPMALRLSLSEDQVAADLTVMPLIVATDYRPIISITQGAELAPRAGDPHGALAHAALAINTESELFTLGRSVVTNSFFGTAVDPFGWIGQSLSVYADDDPFWKELAAVSPQDRERFLLSEGWRLPVGVQIEIANGLKLIPVLAAVRTLVEQTAAGMTRWETRSYLDEPYTRVSLTERGRRGQPELEKAAIYYAAAGDALVISPSEEVLKRALERQIQRREDKEGDASSDPEGQPWLGKSVGVQIDTKLLDALVQFGHQEYQAMMQARAWGNIPILNEWKRRYPDQDAQKLHERLWHSRLVCPGGGQYQWNAQWGTFESTVYGHPGQPKQGPTVPPALAAFARGNFGLTFEHQGLRARVALDRPADVPQKPDAPAAPDQPLNRTGLREQHPQIRQALETLESDPTNADANLAVGKLLCVEQNDWGRGLPFVLLGSDAQWKAAAEREVSATSDPADRIQAGNAWWELAEQLSGAEKRACMLRAGAWYRAAVTSPAASDSVPSEIASRLTTIEALGGTLPALPSTQLLSAAAMQLPPAPLRRDAAPRDVSTQNLRQIGLALHNHHDAFRQFPPAQRCDEHGKPLLSWRVTILPFLEQSHLYDQFHLDEPWDSEHNRRLIAQMPAVYRSPLSRAEPGKTNYLGVGGPRGIFPGSEKVRFANITDGTSNTIAVVEVDDAAAIEWTRPGDFDPEVADLAGKLGDLRNGQFLALLADGSTSMISSTAARPALNALFSRNGGEVVDGGGWAVEAAVPRAVAVPEATQDRAEQPAEEPEEETTPPVPPEPKQPPQPDRYTVPEGGVEELAQFIRDLRDFRPRTQEEYSEHRQRSPDALRVAAEKILSLESDVTSDAHRLASFILLGPVEETPVSVPAVPLEGVSLLTLRNAPLADTKINGSDNAANQLTAGTILAAKTSAGRYSKVLIQQYGYNLRISWVTYNEDGSVRSQGSDLLVRGTFSVDLDIGEEADAGADFWWEQVNETERYLTPRNGALFAVLARPRPEGPPAGVSPASLRADYEAAVEEIQALGGKRLTAGYKPCWSPDGTRIAFSRQRIEDGIGILELATGTVTTLVTPGKDPTWSPDGKYVAYVAIANGGEEEVWLVESTGAQPRRLAEGGFPTWSSDGKMLFYQSRRERRLKILQSPKDNPVVSDGIAMPFLYPAISRDDQLLAYRWGPELRVVQRETGAPVRRARLPLSVGLIANFTPDGKRLGLGGWGGQDQLDLHLLDLETGNLTRLLSRQFTGPVWSPDGTQVTIDLRARTGWEIWLLEAQALDRVAPQPEQSEPVPESPNQVPHQ